MKTISNVLPTIIVSVISPKVIVNSNKPSLTESYLNESLFSTVSCGTCSLALSSSKLLFIAASVKTGFNKVSLPGSPDTFSDESISIDTSSFVSSLDGIVHV